MQDRHTIGAPTVRALTAQRLVLLGLLAPIVAVGVVLWFFLPGGVAGLSYSPGAFSRAVQLKPLGWGSRTVTVRGYLIVEHPPAPSCPNSTRRCVTTRGATYLLADTPTPGQALPASSGLILVLPQAESGWHAFLRRIVPGMSEPWPGGHTAGDRVSVTGTVQGLPTPGQPIALAPRTL